MTDHKIGTREEWLAARLELLEAEKELTPRNSATQRRAVQFDWDHRVHSRSPQERFNLPRWRLSASSSAAEVRDSLFAWFRFSRRHGVTGQRSVANGGR